MEANDILGILGIEPKDDLTVDDIQAHITSKFVPVALLKDSEQVKGIVNQAVGKRLGAAETTTRKAYKELFGENAVLGDDAKIEDVLALMSTTAKAKFEELEAAATGDVDVTQYTTKIESLQAKIQEEETLRQNAIQLATDKENELVEFKNGYKLNSALDTVKKGLVFSDTANELTKEGYWSKVNSSYDFRLPTEDDGTTEALIVVDKTTGKRPQNGTDYLSPLQVLESEAKKYDLLKVSGNNGNNPKPADKRTEVEQDDKKEVPAFLKQGEKHAAALQANQS